ncbi:MULTISPECIES: pantetheine-phosphate adenylyltransferase [Leptospira]|uniref:Phosphopantetheine adenylyltransferase n=4 Tax=Leptospira weilii TaxID=28184 RepID=A0A828YXC4_9LEPT|nr:MULTISPECIES: pantetheine-phosphate adenylyltransferase [Leptospira]EMM72982.1 pantetheine-phosphate adenylyltransferase [Leptospira weilii str. 2006001855]EMY14736.1 pantetheine-phosphate adenylyltransferase [Leptospira weilii str. Ecochallenge]EKR62657.1 pantetheine-phosphate adenylyltransferase [Leptospira weilii str. 2006001853]EMN45998.1 pantetheine-phosphate adenylyltransferase [Leptospira weilii str. LNT 1234]EMN91820.1 pantetheine-phosphate adenylyltransferase [Leptospira weilii str
MKHLAIYPGSFDPLTNGHLDILQRSLGLFDKVIIAIAVNSNKSTLFSIEERLEFIHKVTQGLKGLEVDTFQGLTVDYCNKVGANSIIRGLRAVTDFDYEYAISLMNKKLAPNVETVFLMSSSEYSFISSTIVKEVARHGRDVSNQVPEIVSKALLKKLSQ